MTVRMRINRSQTGGRRSHHALTASASIACPGCKSPMQKHRACANCGKYKGRVVVDVFSKLDKKEKKAKQKSKESGKEGK